MTTLVELLDEQTETNMILNDLDDRFLSFFRQSARDKMDLMEMLREMAGGGSGSETSTGDAGGTTEEEEASGGFMGLINPVTIAAAVAASFLNSLGAVFLDRIPGALSSLGSRISTFTAELGAKFKGGIEDVKVRTFVAYDDFMKKLDGFGKRIGTAASNIADAAKSLAARGLDKLGQTGQAIKGGALGAVDAVRSGASALAGKVQSGVSSVADTARGIGSSIAGKASAIGGSIRGGAETLALKGMVAMDDLKASKTGQALAAVGGKAKGAAQAVAPVANKLLNRVIAPVTSAYAGYQMAQEREDLSAGGKLAAGVGGAASGFAGGFADFLKLLTVDAVIEAGQATGVFKESGLAQDIQDQSVQRDVFDPLVRTARDMLADGIGSGTMEMVKDEKGQRMVFVQNNSQTDQSTTSVSQSGGGVRESATVNNGTRESAYAM